MASHVEGSYNVKDEGEQFIHITGNGTEKERSNAFAIDTKGNGYFNGELYINCENNSTGGQKVDLTKLSDNNYTTDDKNKLDGIQAGATAIGKKKED
jgi:hypothetical protein